MTTSSGSASINTRPIRGLCHQIIIKPTTETTQYTFYIVNSDGAEIYTRTSETGTLSDLESIPVRGIYTLYLTDATKDEKFNIQLLVEE